MHDFAITHIDAVMRVAASRGDEMSGERRSFTVSQLPSVPVQDVDLPRHVSYSVTERVPQADGKDIGIATHLGGNTGRQLR